MDILSQKYFAQVKKEERPFHVYGYVDDGERHGGGQDGVYASNICGYSWVYAENIYNNWIQPHFNCDHDMGNDLRLQLALRAVDGLAVDSLSDREKEYAARAVECGYLYRDGEKLYTKILVCQRKDQNRLFGITNRLRNCRKITATICLGKSPEIQQKLLQTCSGYL
nr:hypothetical protein [uncultured Acetatifactor sp.]